MPALAASLGVIAILTLGACGSSDDDDDGDGGSGDGFVLNVANHEAIVEAVLRVYSAREQRATVLLADDFLAGAQPLSRSGTASTTVREEYVCDGGVGSAATVSEPLGTRTRRITATFEDCLWRGSRLDGTRTLETADGKYFASGGRYRFDDFRVTHASGEEIRFAGELTSTEALAPNGSDTLTWHNRLERYERRGADGTRLLAELDTRFAFCTRCNAAPPHAVLSGGLRLSTPASGEATLTVSTPVPFENELSGSMVFPSGTLLIEAEDGSRIELDADDGRRSRVTLRIGAGARLEERSVPWARWIDALLLGGGPPSDDPSDRPLSDAQRDALPNDCLIATDAERVAYCFSADGRALIAVLPDGSVRYRFVLPGSNEENRVFGLELVRDRLILVAETTGADGVPAHEMSRFEPGGAFVDTVPILEPFRRLRGDFAANPPAWNLDRGGLVLTAAADALLVAASVHALRDGGDPGTREDWRAVGTSITRVDAVDGTRQAYRSLPDASISSLAIVDGVLVTSFDDGTLERYRPEDLAPAGLDPASPPFDTARVPTLVPYLYERLLASDIDELDADIDALLGLVPLWDTPLEPECVPLEPPQVGGDCVGELSERSRRVGCAAGGALDANREAFVRFTSGAGLAHGETRRAAFDGCTLELVTHDSLPAGRYRLSGAFETSAAVEPFHRGSVDTDASAFDELVLTRPDGSTVRASGERRERVTYLGSVRRERDVALERFASSRDGTAHEIDGLELHVLRDDSDEPNRWMTIEGRVRVSGERTGERAFTLTVAPPLANQYYDTDPVQLTGTLRIESDEGDALTLDASESPTAPGEELLRYTRDPDGGVAPATKPFESLLVPFFSP